MRKPLNKIIRIVIGIVIGIISFFIVGTSTQNIPAAFISIVVGFCIGYLMTSASIFRFMDTSDGRYQQKQAEKEYYEDITKEGEAREKGRIRAHGKEDIYRPNNINVNIGSYPKAKNRSPWSMGEDYKKSKKRWENEYQKKDSDMRSKIW